MILISISMRQRGVNPCRYPYRYRGFVKSVSNVRGNAFQSWHLHPQLSQYQTQLYRDRDGHSWKAKATTRCTCTWSSSAASVHEAAATATARSPSVRHRHHHPNANANANAEPHADHDPNANANPFTPRKQELMQFLQNELWHQVDRIIHQIDIDRHPLQPAPSSSSSSLSILNPATASTASNSNSMPHPDLDSGSITNHIHSDTNTDINTNTNTFRNRVEKEYTKRKRLNRKRDLIMHKNRQRLQRRRHNNGTHTHAAATAAAAADASTSVISTVDPSEWVDSDSSMIHPSSSVGYDDNDHDDDNPPEVEEEVLSDDLLLEHSNHDDTSIVAGRGLDPHPSLRLDENHVHDDEKDEDQDQDQNQDQDQMPTSSTVSSFLSSPNSTNSNANTNTIGKEKNRLLAMLEEQNNNIGNDDGNHHVSGMQWNTKVNLMDLLKDDPDDPDHDDHDDGYKSVQSNGMKRNDDAKSESKSLLDLLEEDFFSDATDADGDYEDDDHDKSNHTWSRMDTSSSSSSLLTSKTTLSNAPLSSGSLLDLLSDAEGGMKMDGTSWTRSGSGSGSGSESESESLLDLLNEDGPKSSSRSASLSSSSNANPSRAASLVDLLDDVESIEMSMSGRMNGKSHSHSLMELLENDDEEDEDSLFGMEDPSSSTTFKSNHRTAQPTRSLMDLLDDDFEPEEVRGGGGGVEESNRSNNDTQDVSLLDMLDDIGFDEDGEDPMDEHHDALPEEEVVEAYPIQFAIMRAQALIGSMHKQEWNILLGPNSKTEGPPDHHHHEDEEEDESDDDCNDVEEEPLMLHLYGDDEHDIPTSASKTDESNFHDSTGFDLVDELLLGSSTNRWELHADEFNVLLLNAATSSSPDKIEKMLHIYLHMKELESFGIVESGPNSNTYAIMLNTFDRIPGASAIAFELCNQMIEHVTSTSRVDDGNYDDHYDTDDSFGTTEGHEGGRTNNIMSEETLEIAMRIQAKRLNVDGAERLLNWALSEEGGGIMVNPNNFKMMLVLYKSQNEQEKALELVKTCLEENKTQDWPSLHKFLMNAGSWPRRDRHGEKIAISTYCKEFIRILEDQSGPFVPSLYVWRKLLNFALYAAKVESAMNWPLVHQCCKALLSHRQNLKHGTIDDKFLHIGLDVAEKMKDPQMAADLILSRPLNQDYDTFGDEDDTPGQSQKLPPSACMKAIQVCVDHGKPSLGDRILSHASQSGQKLPSKLLSDMHTLVLVGYAKSGDAEKADHIFNQMKMADLELSESAYAAYIHALAVNKRHAEAIYVLDTMLENANGDIVKPGISSFTACMLAAMQSGAFEDVIRLNDKMKSAGVRPNSTTLQGILIANARLGRMGDIKQEIESVINTRTPIDVGSFLLCAKYIIPDAIVEGISDIESIRTFLRKQVEENPRIRHEAMQLNKSLKDCIREDQRKPSKMKNEILIAREREKRWRIALQDALSLSKVLSATQ